MDPSSRSTPSPSSFSSIKRDVIDNRKFHDVYSAFSHLLGLLLTTSVGAHARFPRAFTIALALVPLHGRRRRCGSLSGRLGKCGHIHFVIVGTTEFDVQSDRLQRGWWDRRRR